MVSKNVPNSGYVLKSRKTVFWTKTSTCRDGLNPHKPTKLDGNDTTILSHHPYILCHFVNYALCLLFVCIGGLWKALGWVMLHGSVVHVDVHGEVMLLVTTD